MSKPVRILLVDDHSLVRAGIRALLDNFNGVEVVGEASGGQEAMSLIASIVPNIVLMDISMPELNGVEATKRITQLYPKMRVIILSMHAGEEFVMRALRAGASGYIIKDAATDELQMAIHAAARGDIYLSPSISKKVVDEYLRHTEDRESPLERLTSRQREVLQLIAEGNTTKQIASILNVKVKTIESHRGQIMNRLEIHNLPGLILFAARSGLISLED